MQPAQLSLLPDRVPAPLMDLFGQLPAPQVAAAVEQLARLVANAAVTPMSGEVGDE